MKKSNLPQTAEEAFARLDRNLKKAEKQELLRMKDPIDAHWGLRLWIRNTWIYRGMDYLPGIGGVGFIDVPKDAKHFFNADDFSGAIVDAYLAHLRQKYVKQ